MQMRAAAYRCFAYSANKNRLAAISGRDDGEHTFSVFEEGHPGVLVELRLLAAEDALRQRRLAAHAVAGDDVAGAGAPSQWPQSRRLAALLPPRLLLRHDVRRDATHERIPADAAVALQLPQVVGHQRRQRALKLRQNVRTVVYGHANARDSLRREARS